MIALRVEKNHLCALLTKLRKGGCEPVCDLTAMSASPFRPLGFSRHWEIYHDEARKEGAAEGTKKGRHAHAYRPSSS
jgi:hypothetical protein